MDYIKNRRNLWLYSATYNNLWWGFNEENNKQLDLIYNDYKERTTKKEDDFIKNVNVIENEDNDLSQEIKNPSFSEVLYEDDNSVRNEKKNEAKVFDYTIRVENLKFYIDFEHWQQINCLNNRKRKIKIINIPDNLSDNELIEFLKSSGIKGISGIVF